MILMIDDVKIVNAETFYPYVSKALGCGADGISDENKLYDALSEIKEPVEVIIHDYDDIPDESRKFAKTVVGTFMDVRMVNKNITVSFVNDETYDK